MILIELNDTYLCTIIVYALVVWWFSDQIPANAMTEMSEFNLREQTSSHRTLPIYGKNGVNYIKAPNKNINRQR